MRNENKGFTLVELLAALVILGIIMAIAVPNIVGILSRNKANTYVEDAKKLVSLAEYKYRSNASYPIPGRGRCVLMTLGYLDSSELDNAPNNGRYSKTKSYVLINYKDNTYKYYVNLVEEILKREKDANGKETVTPTGQYKGLKLTESTKLNNVSNPESFIFENDTRYQYEEYLTTKKFPTIGSSAEKVISATTQCTSSLTIYNE